jgi:hypothetical protein
VHPEQDKQRKILGFLPITQPQVAEKSRLFSEAVGKHLNNERQNADNQAGQRDSRMHRLFPGSSG